MAPNATPPKPTLRSKLHLRPSTSLKVSKVAVFTLLALISVQTVSSALLWYAGKIKADSSSRVVATSPATDVTTTTASLHGTYDYPTDVTQRGFQYGLTTSYGSTVVDSTSPPQYKNTGQLNIGGGSSQGLAVDASGYIYKTYYPDENSASIKKYDPQGNLVSTFSSLGSGNGQIFAPMDIALDASGNMYIADTGNNRVQKLDSSGNYVSRILPLEQATGKVITPSTVTVDSAGNVYIGGSWNAGSWYAPENRPVVQKYNVSGVLQVQMIDSIGTATNQLWSTPANQLSDLATDASNNFYITDAYNYRVLKFDSSGVFAAQWGTTGVAGTAPGEFDRPYGITSGPDGRMYVVDSSNDRVQIFDTNGTYIKSWSGNLYSSGIAVSLSGKIYLNIYNTDTLTVGSSSIDANITSLQCDTTYHYRAFATDADSTEYGADATLTTDACTGLRNITNLPTTNISQTGATLHGATDYPQGITGRGFQYGLTASYGSSATDNSAVSLSRVSSSWARGGPLPDGLTRANDLVVDSLGNIYIADSGNSRVRKYSAAGVWIVNWPTSVVALAIDASDNIYALKEDSSGVVKFDTSGNELLSWGSAGYGSVDGQFWNPHGIDVGPDGSVYVADTDNSRIQKFDNLGNFITKWGVYGQGDSEFGYPDDVAVDSNGNVYVGDYYNSPIPQSYVKKFTASGSFITKWGGNSSTADGKFTHISGLAASKSRESVYVTDEFMDGGGGKIQEFDFNGNLVRVISSGGDPSGVVVLPGDAILSTEVFGGGSVVETYSVPIDTTISGLTCGTTYHYRPYVTDRGGAQYGNDATFTTSACPPLDITTTTLDDGVVGVSYSDLITANNLQGGETYSISSGALPTGLSIDPNTGFITGTPGQAGVFNFDVTVENAGSSDIANLSITIADFANPLSITTIAVADTQVGASYQEYLYTSDSVSDVNFSLTSGALPDGMSITSYGTSGVLYGTPTTPGTFTFTVQAQDSRGAGVGTDTQEYSITVTPSNINITTTDVLNGRVGSSYDRTLQYENANAQPTFSLESGTLPPGVSLTLEGHLQGTPTVAGVYFFSVQADDGFSTDIQGYSFIVVPPLPVANNSPFVTITSPNSGSSFTGGSSVVTGTGPANQAIQILIDGSQVGTTTATTQGTWSYQATGVAAGSHTLDAKWVPSSDVAFVPFMAEVAGQNGVQVIDNTSMKVLRTIGLPADLYAPMGATLNRSGTKLYVFGTNYDLTGTVREINLQTMAQRTLVVSSSTPSFLTSMSITGDDTTAIVTGLTMDGGIIRKLNLETFSLSGDGVTITMQDMGAEAPLLGSLDVSNDTLYAIAMGGLNKVYTYNIANNALQTISIAGGYQLSRLQYVGGKLYVLALGEAEVLVDRPLTLLTLNPSDGVVLNTHVIATLGELGEYLPTVGLAVDPSANFAYVVVGGTGNRLTRVNLSNNQIDAVTSAVATASSDSPNLTTTGDRLYTPGIFGLSAWNTQTLAPLPSDSTFDLYPALGSRVYGSSLLGVITPPKDSISFTVATTPSCEVTGTCPVDCKVTGTCPTDCTGTNSCPVKPPTPETVGTTSATYPKVVTTPFPPAAPTVSRLGWFDRGVLAVARFVPRQAAIGFPFLLFLFLLLFALSLYYQSANEVRKDKLNRQFLAKRKSIRAQQDNFIALASHYLNTPITIIQNGIEVMEESSRGPKSK